MSSVDTANKTIVDSSNLANAVYPLTKIMHMDDCNSTTNYTPDAFVTCGDSQMVLMAEAKTGKNERATKRLLMAMPQMLSYCRHGYGFFLQENKSILFRMQSASDVDKCLYSKNKVSVERRTWTYDKTQKMLYTMAYKILPELVRIFIELAHYEPAITDAAESLRYGHHVPQLVEVAADPAEPTASGSGAAAAATHLVDPGAAGDYYRRVDNSMKNSELDSEAQEEKENLLYDYDKEMETDDDDIEDIFLEDYLRHLDRQEDTTYGKRCGKRKNSDDEVVDRRRREEDATKGIKEDMWFNLSKGQEALDSSYIQAKLSLPPHYIPAQTPDLQINPVEAYQDDFKETRCTLNLHHGDPTFYKHLSFITFIKCLSNIFFNPDQKAVAATLKRKRATTRFQYFEVQHRILEAGLCATDDSQRLQQSAIQWIKLPVVKTDKRVVHTKVNRDDITESLFNEDQRILKETKDHRKQMNN